MLWDHTILMLKGSLMQLILTKGYKCNLMLSDSDIMDLQVNIMLHFLNSVMEVLSVH
jgi:hypothetical protein